MIEPQISPYCGPLFFARSLESAVGNIIANGSYGLIDTARKKLLVTCWHVWDEYRKLHERDSALRMLLCLDRNPPVVLDPVEPIGQDERLDIATFDLEPLQGVLGDRRFYPLCQKPPPQVHVGDKLALIGYPGRFRHETDQGVQFGRFAYGINVSDVSGQSLVADISQMRFIYDQEPKLEEPSQHGGISGSPCFLVRDKRPPQLVAFVTSVAVALNLLRLTSVLCLNPDGTIDGGNSR
jgi:hypothetical protein